MLRGCSGVSSAVSNTLDASQITIIKGAGRGTRGRLWLGSALLAKVRTPHAKERTTDSFRTYEALLFA